MLRTVLLSLALATAWTALPQNVTDARGDKRSKRKAKKSQKKKSKKKKTKTQREADRHFKNGVQLFEERKFAEALAEFEQAYALQPHPLVLYNLAGAHRALSQYGQAVAFYSRFLTEGEGEVSARQLARGRTEYDDLLGLVARIEVVSTPGGANVSVDGREAGETPLVDNLILGPGDHEIEASLDGYQTAHRRLRVAAGDTLRVDFALQEEAATPEAPTITQPPSTTEERHRRWGVSASFGTNALEIADTGAPMLGIGVAVTRRLTLGLDMVVTALSAVPQARFRLFGEKLSVHGVAAVPISFRDGDMSETFVAGAAGIGVRYLVTPGVAVRAESWVSYAGKDHGTTVPTLVSASFWF